MEYVDNSLKLYEKLGRINKNSKKTLPELLKYLGKISSVEQYDDYIKALKVSLFDFGFDILFIRAILLFMVLSCCLPAMNLPINYNAFSIFFMSEGISVIMYLIIDFKKELWRKEK